MARYSFAAVALVVATTVVGVTTAFAPACSFVGGPTQKSMAFSPRVPVATNMMQMNLFDRFSRVAKSNINNVLKNLEDPEKIMTQALEDMQVSNLCYSLTSLQLNSRRVVYSRSFKATRDTTFCD
jgi:phage shock protein A